MARKARVASCVFVAQVQRHVAADSNISVLVLPMPAIEFGLADPNQSIFVDLEIRFDIQLEGWSHIKFSPEPNPLQSVLARTFQWKIQPV